MPTEKRIHNEPILFFEATKYYSSGLFLLEMIQNIVFILTQKKTLTLDGVNNEELLVFQHNICIQDGKRALPTGQAVNHRKDVVLAFHVFRGPREIPQRAVGVGLSSRRRGPSIPRPIDAMWSIDVSWRVDRIGSKKANISSACCLPS